MSESEPESVSVCLVVFLHPNPDVTQLRAMLRNSSALAVTEGQPPFHLADTFNLPKYSPTFYVLRSYRG